jgi:hypothetical protein
MAMGQTGYLTPTGHDHNLKETAFREIHTQFCNANNPLTEVLNQIQAKVDKLSKGDGENSINKTGEVCEPSKYGGMLYELECQKNVAYLNLNKAERILKDLEEII